MALTVGDAFSSTGLAGELYTAIDAALTSAIPDYDPVAAEDGLKAVSNGIATAVIAHLTANLQLNLAGVTAGGDSVAVAPPNAVS